MDRQSLKEVQVGDVVETIGKTPTNVTMFMYSAAVWLTHRIHYDFVFATEHDKLPGAVAQGTLATDWFAQMLLEWAGPNAELARLAYQNRGFMLPGEPLSCGGKVVSVTHDEAGTAVTCEIWIRREDGEDAVNGTATVLLPVVGRR